MPPKSARKPARNVDFESRKPKLPVPSALDVEPSEEEDLLDELSLSEEDDTTKPIVSSRRPAASKKKSVARSRPSPNTEDALDTSPSKKEEDSGHSVSPSLALLLAVSLHLAPSGFTFPAPSCFVPDFTNYFFILAESQMLVHDNNWMSKLCPYYNSLITTIYYGIIGVIQVLRSRVHANIATTAEGKFLRSFEKQFPFEALPVSGPMAGFLEILGSVKLNDAAYTWVSACLPTFPWKINADHTARGACRFPPIPQLMAVLQNFVDAWSEDDEEALWNGTNLTKFGALDLGNPGKLRFMLSPGSLSPYFDPSNLGPFRRFVRSLSLPTIADDYNVAGVEELVCMPKIGEHSWFYAFAKVAQIEADFFIGSTTLAKITPSSDLSLITEIRSYGDRIPAMADSADGWKKHHFRPHRLLVADNYAAYHRIPDCALPQFQLGISCGFLTTFAGNHGSTDLLRPTFTDSGPFFSADGENLNRHALAAAPRPTLKMALDSFKTPIYISSSFMVGKLFLEKGKRTKE